MRKLPWSAVAYQRTAEFDEGSVPAGLTRAHTTKAGVWGRIAVSEGRLRYRILEPELEEHLLTPGSFGVVEPEVPHEVEPDGPVRFHVEFLRCADRNRIVRFWVGTALANGLLPLLLFGSAGTLAWPMAWAYLAISWVSGFVGAASIPPDLAAERGGVGEDAPRSDLALAALMARVLPLALLVAAGLEHRFGGSAPADGWAFAAAGMVAGGAALINWAMVANRFFAPVVRIQHDRGHEVVDSGPYAFVRHPGYAGMILYIGAIPFLLQSSWALLPAALAVAVAVVRAALEDRFLARELSGYDAYAARVRYRLVPGLW